VTFANGANGMHISTNSNLKLRNSYSAGNKGMGTLTNPVAKAASIPTGHGIYIGPADGITVAPTHGAPPHFAGNDGNDSSRLDLGMDSASNAGHNVFQDAANLNANMGVCWFPTSDLPTQLLNVAGNIFDVQGLAASHVDCTSSSFTFTADLGNTCNAALGGQHAFGIASGAVGPVASDFNAGTCTVPK
jgi:hypothetical protein